MIIFRACKRSFLFWVYPIAADCALIRVKYRQAPRLSKPTATSPPMARCPGALEGILLEVIGVFLYNQTDWLAAHFPITDRGWIELHAIPAPPRAHSSSLHTYETRNFD